MSPRFRAAYGAGALHLIVLLAGFVIAGLAIAGWFSRPRDVVSVLEWFVAAIVIHDLVLLPFYTVLDRVVFWRLHRGALRPRTAGRHPVHPAPYMRIPAMLSGLLLLVFFPVIFGLGSRAELNASGIAERGYLARWLIATGGMFAASAVMYAVAAHQARRHPKPKPAKPASREAANERTPPAPRGSPPAP